MRVQQPIAPLPATLPPDSAGWWRGAGAALRAGDAALADALLRVSRPIYVLGLREPAGGGHSAGGNGLAVAQEGRAWLHDEAEEPAALEPAESAPALRTLPLRAWAPALVPGQLGDAAFRAAHNVRLAYVVGEMANGIASVEMVRAAGRAGMIGFFGAAGLTVAEIESAVDLVERELEGRPFGFNLIHSPSEPALEAATVDLYLRRRVRRVSASAFLDLTLPLVRYRVRGLGARPDGAITAQNHLFAKVSRVELARKFLSPPPDDMLAELVRRGEITPAQARMAATLPLAEDLTAEADSGGHTDNRPLVALLPTMLAVRDELQTRFAYVAAPRVGAAGGIGTPHAAAAALALGAAYVMTGSINQSCREAGTSELVRRMLAAAQQADVVMAPAADMFELGVKVQVLKRGTMFAMRARRLYELYRQYNSLEELPPDVRSSLERECFRGSLDEAWRQTCAYFEQRDASQIRRAEQDARHRMALVFRAYLGQTSGWAQRGEAARQVDFQVWCGPAMGAFNEWVRGSWLERPENRDVVSVGLNILFGAAVLTRASWLKLQGVPLPPEAERFSPLPVDELQSLLSEAR